jgi:hypothetical protein
MSILPNFMVTHQWLRELKRNGQRTFLGVRFRIQDKESVWVGHFSQPHQQMSASQAMAFLMHLSDPLGYEVIIPRKITPGEIKSVNYIPQFIGWRYSPTVRNHGYCGCPYCIGYGGIKSRRKRERYEKML